MGVDLLRAGTHGDAALKGAVGAPRGDAFEHLAGLAARRRVIDRRQNVGLLMAGQQKGAVELAAAPSPSLRTVTSCRTVRPPSNRTKLESREAASSVASVSPKCTASAPSSTSVIRASSAASAEPQLDHVVAPVIADAGVALDECGTAASTGDDEAARVQRAAGVVDRTDGRSRPAARGQHRARRRAQSRRRKTPH